MITLRPATRQDRATIVAISQSAYWCNFRELEPDAWGVPGYRKAVRAMQVREAAEYGNTITIAEMDGTPRGWGRRAPDENEITEMWVHEDWQGKGLGTALLTRFIADMRSQGLPEAWIETHRRNAGAIRLYERMGFRPDHETVRISERLGREIPIIRLRQVFS